MKEKRTQLLLILTTALGLAVLAVGCGEAPAPEASPAKSPRVEQLKRQLASLQKQYDNADARLKMLQDQLVYGDAGPITSYLPVADILDEMFDFRIGSKSRRVDTRRLNFLMESLIRQGDASVPAIRKFLEKMEDVDYAIRREGEEDEEEGEEEDEDEDEE